ncbi:MAG: oligosaccharide flippase family protein [Burkholderiales bacterium]
MQRDTKIFLINTFHLTFLRGVSRVAPLIYTPYLIHKLGLSNVGTLEFVKAISFYFSTFVSYGFRYSATKQVSLYKEQKNIVGEIISSVYALKLIALGISFLLILGLVACVPTIRQDKIYLLTFFPVVMGSTLFPTFVFQALEKMKWLTTLNLITKALFITSIFMWVQGPADTLLLPILLGSIDLLRLFIALYLVYNKLGVPWALPNRAIMVEQLKEGVHIFFPELATMFYARFPAIFLRLFVGPTAVGIYTLGDRLIRTTTGMIDPFMQALYPVAYKQFNQDQQEGIRLIKRVAMASLAVLAVVGMLYWYFADPIVALFAGKPLPAGVRIFKLHAFLPCIVILSNIVGIGILLPLKTGNQYTFSMFLAGLLCAALHFLLVPTMQTQGAAWAILIAETAATVMMLGCAHHRLTKKNPIKY